VYEPLGIRQSLASIPPGPSAARLPNISVIRFLGHITQTTEDSIRLSSLRDSLLVEMTEDKSTTDDDEYEYLYDDTETETFLVELDVSSGRRSLNKPRSTPRVFKEQKTALPRRQSKDTDENGTALIETISSTSNPPSRGPSNPGPNTPKVRIMELNSRQPIVLYGDQVYGCSWTDIIGTDMFFKASQSVPIVDGYQTSEKPLLLGTSRIKLTGRHATVTNVEPRKRARVEDSSHRSVPIGEDFESLLRADKNDETQENFLQRLHLQQLRARTNHNAIESQESGNHRVSEVQLQRGE
jgi:TFIIIC subunit triple barrel domain